MNLVIQPVNQPQGCWQVRLDQHHVTFRSESEARQFVSTLQARLQAPHSLPREQQRIAS